MKSILCLMGVLLPLASAGQPADSPKTERVSFEPGGLIRIDGSDGTLNVEGWDRPEVEVTVAGRDQPLVERRSRSELAITASKQRGDSVNYEIRVPRVSRIEIHHGTGQVLVADIAGDIQANAHRGDILLMLPEPATYAIDAKTKIGVVTSDFPANLHHRWYLLGERMSSAAAPHQLHLRMGLGGITIKRLPAALSTY